MPCTIQSLPKGAVASRTRVTSGVSILLGVNGLLEVPIYSIIGASSACAITLDSLMQPGGKGSS